VPGLAEAGLSRVDPARALAAARDGVDAVMPDLLPAFDRVGKRVLRALAADRGPDVLLHGDLSADQAVLDGRGAVRLIDLDRLAIGPAGCDLGGFAAVELLLGRGAHAAEALVGAYGRRMGVDGMDEAASNAWTAYHLLLRLAEPFRALAPDYREQGAARIERACAVLTGGWGAGEWGADG
jgi:aminoglycoside phosphotransferase (APT) family kinase protein